MNESCHTDKRVLSHIWISHVTHMIQSCHTDKRVLSHTWMSHVTHMNESCHTYEWVMSHIWISHVPQILQIIHRRREIYSSHIWTSHVAQINKSRHTHEWVMSHTWMSHVTHMLRSVCNMHVIVIVVTHWVRDVHWLSRTQLISNVWLIEKCSRDARHRDKCDALSSWCALVITNSTHWQRATRGEVFAVRASWATCDLFGNVSRIEFVIGVTHWVRDVHWSSSA